MFTVPDPIEARNYFVWRQQDATRNSIAMAAQTMYSHKELHGKDTSEQQEMMFRKGVNWNDYPAGFKRGRAVVKVDVNVPSWQTMCRVGEDPVMVTVQEWAVVEPPVFTQDKEFLRRHVPSHPDFREFVPAEPTDGCAAPRRG